jgi:hypothetical protein
MSIFEKFSLGLGAFIVGAAIVAFAALFSGTLLWLIWPYAFPVVFPKAVASGIILPELSWWTAVCLAWVCGILIKGTPGSNIENKKK